VKWSYSSSGPGDSYVNESAAIGANGDVYVGFECDDGNGDYWGFLSSLNGESGTLRWSFGTGLGVGSSPAIGADGTVYVGSYDDNIYALDRETGAKKWSFATGLGVESSPAIGADGTIYVGSDDKNVYAIGPRSSAAYRGP
jgi:outer membrane protein assembly factor BamB